MSSGISAAAADFKEPVAKCATETVILLQVGQAFAVLHNSNNNNNNNRWLLQRANRSVRKTQ